MLRAERKNGSFQSQAFNVDKPPDAHRGVDGDPAERVYGFNNLELQQRVHQVGDFGEVFEEVANPGLCELRQHEIRNKSK
jgi:hypothetical protein